MGRKKEMAEEPPIRPILEQPREPPPREDFGIPAPQDIRAMPPPPEIPEPPSFPPPTEGFAPVPPAIEERRRQRIEGFRRARGYEPQTAEWPPSPQPSPQQQAPQQAWEAPQPASVVPQPPAAAEHRLVQRRPQTVESALATMMDHLDRIEQRLIDLDRRLAMLESATRLR